MSPDSTQRTTLAALERTSSTLSNLGVCELGRFW